MSVYAEKILGELLKVTSLRLALIDSSGCIKHSSDGFSRTYPDLIELTEDDTSVIRFQYLDRPEDLKRAISQVTAPGSTLLLDITVNCNGVELQVKVSVSPLFLPDVDPLFLTVWNPAGDPGEIQQALLESEKRYMSLQENLPVGIYRALEDGELKTANRALIEMMGYDSFQDLQEAPLENVWVDPDCRTQLIDRLRSQGSVTGFQVNLRRKDGSELIGSFDARGTFDASGDLKYFDTIVSDITRRVEDKRELERLARTDSLTGILNRQYLMEKLYSEVSRSGRYDHPTGLALIDIDNFKMINDTHGHLTGDSVLVTFASKVSGALRDSDFAGRYGGEEFCVVLPETDLAGAAELAERIRAEVESMDFCGEKGEELKVTCSVGVSSMTGEYSASDLIFLADQALYEAKRKGRNRIELSEKWEMKE